MIEILTLKRQDAYTVYASAGDIGLESGIYETHAEAEQKCEGAGAFYDDGFVRSKEVWVDSEGNVYSLKILGNFNKNKL